MTTMKKYIILIFMFIGLLPEYKNNQLELSMMTQV